MRMGKNMLHQPIPPLWIQVSKPVKRSLSFRTLDLMNEVSLLFMAECFAVGDKKLEVPGIGFIHIRVVDLVDDTVTEGKPEAATRMIGGADSYLRARSPPRRRSWCAKRHRISAGFKRARPGCPAIHRSSGATQRSIGGDSQCLFFGTQRLHEIPDL